MPAKTRPRKNANQQKEATEVEDNNVQAEPRELGEDEYKVDRILFENQTPEGLQYLIKWLDYCEEEATWQSVDDLTAGADDILMRWADDKKRIAEGFANPFDIDDWERRRAAFHESRVVMAVDKPKEHAPRKPVARAPRKTVSSKLFISSDEESDYSDDDDDDDEDDGFSPNKQPEREAMPEKTGATASSKTKASISKDLANATSKKSVSPKSTLDRSMETPEVSISKKGNDDSTSTSKKRKKSPTRLVKNPAKKTKSLRMTTTTAAAEPESSESTPASEAPAGNATTGFESLYKTAVAPTTPGNTVAQERQRETTQSEQLEKAPTSKPAKRTETAQNVFGSNDEDLPVRRTRRLAENGRIYTPSHIQNIIRKNQDGKAPDPKDLVLQCPSEMAARPLNCQGNTPTTPSTPTILAAPTQPASNAEAPRRPSAQLSAIPTLQASQSIPLLCHYFASDRICPEGESQCRFLHQKHQNLNIAPLELHHQAREYITNPNQWPKFNTPAIVCGFEFRSQEGCYRGEACAYAHWKPLKGQWIYHDNAQKGRKTCPYWLKGFCFKAEVDCPFAHEKLDEVAAPAEGSTLTMTCPFWFDATYNNGLQCNKGIKCMFAHEIMPVIAANPRTKTPKLPMDPTLLQLATGQPANEWPRSSLHIDIPQPAYEEEMPRTAQRKNSNTIPTIAVQQLSLNGPTMPVNNVGDMFDAVMTTDGDGADGFSILMDIGAMQITARFLGLNSEIRALLQNRFAQITKTMQPRVSLWEDIQAFTISLYSNKIANGILLGSGTGQEMAELADHLAHEGTGLIMEAKDVIILLFPNRGTLEEDGPPPRSTIGYEIRRATEYTTDEDWMEPADEDGDWSLWFRKTFGMDIEALFQWPTNPNVIKKEVFLMLDECQEAELEALSRCFRWMGVTVYTAESPGAWNEFKTRNEGVVIFDERFTRYESIPHLSHLLFCRYNFFELATNSETQRLTLTRLFKTGHTIFLTDQVLMQEPDKVLEVVQHVKERNKCKLPGFETRRFFARPGVVDWLHKLAEEHIEDHKTGDVSRASLWDEITTITPIDSPREILELTDRVVYEPYWYPTHAEDFEKDPDAATETLLKAFNSTSCLYREQCRHWIVLYPNTEDGNENADMMKKAYCNMRFMTVEEFKKKIIAKY